MIPDTRAALGASIMGSLAEAMLVADEADRMFGPKVCECGRRMTYYCWSPTPKWVCECDNSLPAPRLDQAV